MAETVLTLTAYKCDGCDAKEEFKNESGEPSEEIRERWRLLVTATPGPYQEATGQSWLFCRPCYKRATEALANLWLAWVVPPKPVGPRPLEVKKGGGTRRAEDGDG